MLQNLVNKAQYVFGAGLAGLGLYGIVEAAMPTQMLSLIMAACTLAAGVNVIVKTVEKPALNQHRTAE